MRILTSLATFLVLLLVPPAFGAGVDTAAAADKAQAPIKTATLEVDGRQKQVLTDARGHPLYYFTSDTPRQSRCTGRCIEAWPPLTVDGEPTSEPELDGELTILAGPNGRQVVYNGHPLYVYAADAPGQVKGHGLEGKWFVATPELAPAQGPGS